jgi:chromosome segregation ATPase
MIADMRHSLLSVLAVVAVSGCASMSKNCDPTTGGLLGAIGCDASGKYDERLAERQSQETALMQRKADLIQQRQAVQAEQETIASELSAKQADLDKAQRELAAVRAKLKSGQATSRNLSTQTTKLEQDIAKSQHDIDDLKQAETKRQARLAELEREQGKLNKEYEAATGSAH